MMGRVLLARRTPVEWAVRVVLVTVAALLGYFSLTHSMALAVRNGAQARGHQLAPQDGRITAAAAAKELADHSASPTQGAARQLALKALRQDATAVKAVITLGLQAQSRNDTAQARRLFAYAQRLSRRELQTQLWLIVDEASRNNVPGALHQYDIALRTSKSAPDVLFPTLASAIADPAVRTSTVATLARKPIWGAPFIVFVANSGDNPLAVADLLLRTARRGVRVPDEPSAVIINRLIHADAADAAWRYYTAIRPGAKREVSRDPNFAAVFERPTAFDWTAVNENNISASLQSSPEGGALTFSVAPGAGGVLVQQTQMLPSGTYRLHGKGSEIEQPQQSLPYWVLNCRNGAELGRVAVPNSADKGGVFTGQFTVPPNCPVQTLALIARPSDEITGLSGQIVQARLEPIK
ncbi:hypothetical protein LQ954_15630 [Sphingomonas sp. IC-11]|uniref:hypothetical protein n=1 Tax=Sphingomonas sp. IC-11 TaxID=2898528 RepID=UPI001E3FB86E|nr:hypothetical protein [Sphingomonas sp. IC-11]MCD2317579.1 hypothetical protein [Sphingomonas sp. IC-11]